ncbi:MAG: LytTR family DNA-binding domain-containing protein [Bacteroidota bacterium]
MKVLIIEDERLAISQLKRTLSKLQTQFEIIGVIESKEEAINQIPNLDPDLIFMDIHLSDGMSFDIFSAISIEKPVIFTTAYDEYSLRAFKHYSIDYLLKPIEIGELERAVNKFINHFNPQNNTIKLNNLLDHIQGKRKFKTRFLIKVGARLKSIEAKDIAYFFAQDKSTYICTFENRKYPVDISLKDLDKEIEPSLFFRVNRKHIINRKAMRDIIYISPTRLSVSLLTRPIEEVIVAGERIGSFKKWLSS